MKSARIGIVFVVVISISFCYQEITPFLEIPYTVTGISRRREGIPVVYKVIFLLLRLALRVAFIFHHSHSQDSEESSCLCCHFRSFVEHDPIVLHYKQIFHVFDFSILPETKRGPVGNGRIYQLGESSSANNSSSLPLTHASLRMCLKRHLIVLKCSLFMPVW